MGHGMTCKIKSLNQKKINKFLHEFKPIISRPTNGVHEAIKQIKKYANLGE